MFTIKLAYHTGHIFSFSLSHVPTLLLEYHSRSSSASGRRRRLGGEARWRPDKAVHNATQPAIRVVRCHR